MNNNLGKKLKQARIAMNMSQDNLAELINKSAPTIRKYENGERNPPLSVVKQISEVLNINLSQLINEENSISASQDDNKNVREQLNSIVNSICSLYNKENTLNSSEIDDLQEIIAKLILFKLK